MKYEKKCFEGWVTYSFHKDTKYQLFLDRTFVEQLKDRFIMSYMRSLEQKLRQNNVIYKAINIEEELPFWEFLDIEFDPTNKIFICKAHYFQKPMFPELFKQFISSHVLKEMENKILEKRDFKFIKENWQPRSKFKTLIEKNNIVYYLIDTKNKLLYIGEAEHTKRIAQFRKELPDWDFFRIDLLPSWLTRQQRLEIERLIIRSFASVLPNNKNIDSMKISDYKLLNRKIDS